MCTLTDVYKRQTVYQNWYRYEYMTTHTIAKYVVVDYRLQGCLIVYIIKSYFYYFPLTPNAENTIHNLQNVIKNNGKNYTYIRELQNKFVRKVIILMM